MEFTKIKDDGSQVTLRWATKSGPKGKDETDHELRSFDRPHPDFLNALQGLVKPILKLLELPSGYESDFRVQGVSISHQEDNWGAVFTCLKGLKDTQSPLVLNTPYLPDEPTSEGGPSLPSDLVTRLSYLEAEAEAYKNGKREQADLFGAGEERPSQPELVGAET